MKNADANGSSVALTRSMDKSSREATSAMRASWKLYYVASFAETYGEALRLPARDVGAWERALRDPSENMWIVEFYLRVWVKKHDEVMDPPTAQSRALLLIPEDWEREERRVAPRAMKRIGVEYDVDARGGFMRASAMDRLDVLFAVCDEALDRREWSAGYASRSAERLERARARADKCADAKKRAKVFRDVDRGVHGESIGEDAKGCSYYVTANDTRLFRSSPPSASGSGDAAPTAPIEWCAPFVSLDEVTAFARSMKKTTDRRERALYEYLTEDHIPFHEDRLRRLEEEKKEEEKKEDAERAAREKAEEQRRRIELIEKTAKRSDRLGAKKAALEAVAVRDREPETISFDRQKEVLEDLRRWLLTPPSLRESDQPPHDVRERMLLVVNRVCDFRMPKLKPRGRAWRGWCVLMCGDDDDETDPDSWSDAAVCVDYDAGHDKVRVYHLETGKMEFINMDAVPVRLGYATPYMKEMFDKKGRPRVSRECVRRECSDLCLNRSPPIVIYTGCWRDHIVGEGVPSYGDVGKIMLHVQHHDDMYAELDGEWEASLYETTETDTDADAETEIVVEKQTEDDDEETTTTIVLDDVPVVLDDVPSSE